MDRLNRLYVWLGAFECRCALVLGLISATGFQPLGLWPLTLLALAGFAQLIARAENARRAALIGWLFGLGHFALGNHWIATAFTYQAQMPPWLGWLGVLLVSAFIAIYPALAALGAWLIQRRLRGDLTLALAACWIVTEWLRSWVFTGYAWNPLGAVLLGDYDTPGLAHLTPWLGTYGLSGIAAVIGGTIRHAIITIAGASGRPRQMRLGLLAILALLLVVAMHSAPFGKEAQGTLAYTLIQPDLRQEDIGDPRQYEAQFLRTARLSQSSTRGITRLVLWPESGVPDYLRDGYPQLYYEATTFAADPKLARERIGQVIGPGSLLLTGVDNLEVRGGEVIGARNSITALDEKGAIRGSYAKAHLVPYGEYQPMRPLLEPLGLSRLVAGTIDFWPGPGPRTLDLGPWGKAGMQICYEIVFSGQVVDRNHRPDYIFNPSNDGWFGSWGPPQHLAQARLRAIEEGLPVLRSTTTGISAVIDANGVVRQHLPRFTAAKLEGMIPPAHAPTLFARLGNLLPLGWAVVLLVLSLVASRRHRG